jgi:hypothetical protein
MTTHPFSRHARALALSVCILAPCAATAAPAQVNVPLADDVVPAPAGFEAVASKYVTAKPTDLYIGPFLWAGKVKGTHLNAGAPVQILARPTGYDWLLVGQGGQGIGYVPLSAVKPAR